MKSRAVYLPLCSQIVFTLFLQGSSSSLPPAEEEEDSQALYTINSVHLTLVPAPDVVSGTHVTLRCEVSVSHASSEPLTHHFLFLRDDVEVYSRNSSDPAVSYFLFPARAAHSGTYECRVKVHDKSRTSHAHKLTVTGLQTPQLQVSAPQVFQGEEVTASCRAPQEQGSLTFHFYLDQEQIKTVRSQTTSVETRLLLSHTGDRKLSCTYTVTMVPQAGLANHSNIVGVLVKGLFITPIMNVLPSKILVEGDVVEFICRVVEPPSNTEVFLTKDHKILKKGQSSLVHRFEVRAEDSGEYDCKAERRNVQKETSENIQVKELFSKPVLTMDPREVFEGERFTLTCSVSRLAPERLRPQDVYFSLFKDQLPLEAVGGRYSAVALPTSSAAYSCRAQSRSLGSLIAKNSSHLHLEVKVPVSVPQLSVVGGSLVLGRPFQLLCQASQGSLPIRYVLQGPLGGSEVRVVSRSGERALFNVSSIQEASDVDGFVCQASNNPASSSREAGSGRIKHINIIEPVSPPVLTVSPAPGQAAEGDQLTLTCSVQRGTPPITFSWFHTASATPLAFKTTNELRGSHVITELGQKHAGGYYCSSSNPSNHTQQGAMVTVGVSVAGWKKWTTALVCVLLVLILIFILLAKKRLLPFQKRKRSDLSVKTAGTKTDGEGSEVTLGLLNEAANVTPGVMGRSVWSEHVSGSESDDPSHEEHPEAAETQYTEVQPPPADPNRAPVKPGTDTVYSEVHSSVQGFPDQTDGASQQGSVEYAQLNHDGNCDHDDYIDDCSVNTHSNQGDQGDHGDTNGPEDHGSHGNLNGNCDHGDHNNCVDNGDYDNRGDVMNGDE